jgi:hypothetical protein
LIASASDDGNVLVWDEDEKAPVETIELGYPITSVSQPTIQNLCWDPSPPWLGVAGPLTQTGGRWGRAAIASGELTSP